MAQAISTPLLDLAVHGDLVLPAGEVLKGGWLGVHEGRIVSMSARPLEAQMTIDAKGKLVLPGVVDAHVHTRSNPDEGIAATTRAAAAGGVTTVIDMPFDSPARPVRTAELLNAKVRDIEREAIVDVGLYATFAPEGGLEHIPALAEAGACGFKVSVYGVDPVRFPRIPDNQLVDAFHEIARTGLPVAAHQENQEIVDAAIAKARHEGRLDAIEHARTRPAVAETEAAGRLLEFAHWSGARLHMVHGTVPRTFDLIAWHRSSKTAASGETCIQYLTMNEAELERQGAKAKCNPPLRSAADVEALWGYLREGKIDIVTSDHSPYGLERKLSGTIFDAAAGMPGVETLLTLLYSEGVAQSKLSLARLVEVLASKPAEIFGLASKGRLRVGGDADFVIFDPTVQYTLDENTMHYAAGWSPFHGKEVTGRVEATYSRGVCVYRDGDVRTSAGTGHFVRPTRERAG